MRQQPVTNFAALLLFAPMTWAQEGASPAAPDPAPEPQTAQQSQRSGQLVVPAGTWIKIRVDDRISSNNNRSGDYFTGTIAQPVIVDGYVVARRGQNIEG